MAADRRRQCSVATTVACSGNYSIARYLARLDAAEEQPTAETSRTLNDARNHRTASVIIPAHNAARTIGRQLGSLCAQVGSDPFEVVVVLNRCTDETRQVCEQYAARLPGLRLLTADDRASAGYARNAGARAATGSELLFCDADDELGDRWVISMMAGLETADIVAGALVPDTSSLPEWMLRIPGMIKRPQAGLTLFDSRIWYPPTACFGCHRSDFETVAGFDESFAGATAEDLELARRLFTIGCRLGIAHDAQISYTLRPSYRSFQAQQVSYTAANAKLLAASGRFEKRPALRALGESLRQALSLAIRRQETDPRPLLARIALAWRLARTHNKAKNAAPSCSPLGLDFVVRVDAPVIGGLGFLVSQQSAFALAESWPPTCVLTAIESHVRKGDHVALIAGGEGVIGLAAAAMASGSGQFTMFEDDPSSRLLAEENFRRHKRRSGPVLYAPAEFSSPGSYPARGAKAMDVVIIDLSRASSRCMEIAHVLTSSNTRLILVAPGDLSDKRLEQSLSSLIDARPTAVYDDNRECTDRTISASEVLHSVGAIAVLVGPEM